MVLNHKMWHKLKFCLTYWSRCYVRNVLCYKKLGQIFILAGKQCGGIVKLSNMQYSEYLKSRVEIHQPFLSYFSLLVEFFIGKVPVYNKDSRVLVVWQWFKICYVCPKSGRVSSDFRHMSEIKTFENRTFAGCLKSKLSRFQTLFSFFILFTFFISSFNFFLGLDLHNGVCLSILLHDIMLAGPLFQGIRCC